MSNADVETLKDTVFGIDTFYVTGEPPIQNHSSAVVQSRLYGSLCSRVSVLLLMSVSAFPLRGSSKGSSSSTNHLIISPLILTIEVEQSPHAVLFCGNLRGRASSEVFSLVQERLKHNAGLNERVQVSHCTN